MSDSIRRLKKGMWCGYSLTPREQKELTVQSLREFRRPISERMRPFQLVEMVKKLLK